MASLAPPGDRVRPSSRHIASLDGYRGIAFLLVFLRHYTLTRHSRSPILLGIMDVGAVGWAGVDLFFVLSGFLITGILLDTRTEPHYFRNFIVRRALRIFPLYYAVLFIMLALTPLLHLQWHRGQIAYFFYLGNVAANINPHLDSVQPYFSLLHLWSLSLEEQFYLLWPVVIYFAAASSGRVIRLCAGLSLFALAARVAVLHWLPEGRAVEWCSAELPTRMDPLLYGAIAAVLVRRFPIERLIPTARWLFFGSAAALAVMFYRVGVNFTNRVTSLIGYPLLALFFTSLLVLALDHRSLFARFGNISALRFLGRYSYGLYVYHLIAGFALGYLLVWLQQKTQSVVIGGLLFTFIVFFGSLGMAIASYELFERRFLRLKRHFTYDKVTDVPARQASAITTA